jgi:bis(5'-nucleosyl)-tetraphosphatase (symmetrical)
MQDEPILALQKNATVGWPWSCFPAFWAPQECKFMRTWIIGDIQGCFRSLSQLLIQCEFRPDRDRLWLTGDLVNRGPRSLETLEWIYAHRDQCTAVLGNHDIHLLMRAEGLRAAKGRDTLDEILAAPERETWLDWLRRCPMLHVEGDSLMVHAGLLPKWSIQEALLRAQRVEHGLRGDYFHSLLSSIANKKIDHSAGFWGEEVETVSIMTRIRMLDESETPRFGYSGSPESAPAGYSSWFERPHQRPCESRVFFGHWAALGYRQFQGGVALDSGCVWKNQLTAYCMEDDRVCQQEYCD